jgi:hypothetical protein
MSEEDLNCYITKMFFENTIDDKEIKVINFESENMTMFKKTQIVSKDRHDKIIISNSLKKPIVSFSNNIIYDNGTIDIVSKLNWKSFEIIEYNFNSAYVILFYQNETWYITYDETITKLSNVQNLYSRVLNNLFAEYNIELSKLQTNVSYHLMLTHPSLSKVTQHDVKSITLLWTCDNTINLIDIETPFNKNLKYFSCLDELQISLEIECNNDMMNKSLSFGGYFIKIPYLFGNKQQYMCCVIRSNLYKHILSILPKNDNKYISYLELYQKNELSDVIVYIHKYPNDVIRRINMAIRTLSKEILNIYHLTRKKQNIVLYTNLSRGYKKVLFELHKIYVTQKHLEISSKQSKNGAQLIEKKSISVDVVYDYLKSINVSDLIQIFKDRTEIINALVDENYKLYNIFNLNDIYIVTQIELMFNKN